MNCIAFKVSPRLPISNPESSPFISICTVSKLSTTSLDLIFTDAFAFMFLINVSTVSCANVDILAAGDVSLTLMRAGSAPNPNIPPLPGLRTSIST